MLRKNSERVPLAGRLPHHFVGNNVLCGINAGFNDDVQCSFYDEVCFYFTQIV